ncbi:MAG TPA: CGNR zinc finger domain-containing protein [Micromonosporaceae bacterium]
MILNLVNTVTARNAEPVDWLDGYPRLLEWAELTGDFAPTTLAALRRASAAGSRAANLALRNAKALRETLWEVLSATIEGRAVPQGALERLQSRWRSAVAHASLTAEGRHVATTLSVETSGLEYLSHVLVLRAVRLLETLPLDRTRICAGPQCGWLFIDRSKAGKRRWCDMATCGSAAKTRTQRQRMSQRAHRG